MKTFDFLLFDVKAISELISNTFFQSVEYTQGKRLIAHICGELQSEILENILVEYTERGIIFMGKKTKDAEENASGKVIKRDYKIFCIDLTKCNILKEKGNPNDLMTLMQKSFRTVYKIWNHQPFGFSERMHGSKSIIFPFIITDRRRIVIERSNHIAYLENKGIKQPLLAYKYSAEDPPQGEEIADTRVLKVAGEVYASLYFQLQNKFNKFYENEEKISVNQLKQVTATVSVRGDGFIYQNFDIQLARLTEAQRTVVEYENVTEPLRVDGAAGTGKTVSLVMRAYHLLCKYKEKNVPFQIAFFTHSASTNRRNKEMFEIYPQSQEFLNSTSLQNIRFVTLLDFCSEFVNISAESLLERDASDAKTYQLMLIETSVEKIKNTNVFRTYKSLLSKEMQDIFDSKKTPKQVLYSMLQHEFSIQIKGRTDCTIDKYYEIPSIKNGLPCRNKKDKEFVFMIFGIYQDELKNMGSFDVDDVIMEALAPLNAPVWRRERVKKGYDYIIVDEMHLFNVNEQSVFHFLTKNIQQKSVPICFALDYSQAIGDRGNNSSDYIEKEFGMTTERKKYCTVFRNSPQISSFCASLAAAGTLMFQESFLNPYDSTKSNFTEAEEKKSCLPKLYMYNTDEDMYKSLEAHLNSIVKELQCKPCEIAIISFDNKLITEEGVRRLEQSTEKKFELINFLNPVSANKFVVASPYDINGLEFQAVVLVGVDEGRVPQTTGTSDISKHFILYSAYNLLYIAASRAKYKLNILGNRLNGVSSCLEYSLNLGQLEKEEN